MNYCLGFIFDQQLEKVLLIEKNKPEVFKGRLNGIGGKIEKDESGADAMVRECREETGLIINDWKSFCSLEGEGFKVYCYYAVTDDVFNFKQMEEEFLGLYDLYAVKDAWTGQAGPISDKFVGNYSRLFNLDWLIPMAINHHLRLDKCQYFEIKEK